MKTVSDVSIVTIRPKHGMFAFAYFVLYEKFYVAEVGVHSRPEGGIRLVYPRKRNRDLCYPIDSELGDKIERAVEDYMNYHELI